MELTKEEINAIKDLVEAKIAEGFLGDEDDGHPIITLLAKLS